MNYEKAYKGALERAEGIIKYYKEHNRGDEASIEDLEIIFPELRESEDEKIRESLIKHFREYESCTFDGLPNTKVLDWLERQGGKHITESQSRWKPSEEQMKTLEYIINNAHNTSYSCKIAKELLEQLKKLK
jgi:hypothetical protein